MEHAEIAIYHCDPRTGEFLGEGAAYVGPAGDVQVPAFAAVTPPPECPTGHVAVMLEAPDLDDHTCQWAVVRCWRNTPLYRTSDGSSFDFDQPDVAWDGLSNLPEQLTSEPRPSSFHVWTGSDWQYDLVLAKAAKVEEINAERAKREHGTFPYAGKRFNADQQSEQRILSTVQFANLAKVAGRTFIVGWTAVDDTELELDADGLIELTLALASHRENCHKTARQLKLAVAGADTALSVASIVWPEEPLA